MNNQAFNKYAQYRWGPEQSSNPGGCKIANKGDLNMGSSTGATNNFNNQGNHANKQIQGVNGGSIKM
ncbi:hypothetical protein CKAN_01911200 [Cinnamomum micranthum f. kanehirae]|uniref:Uncharacterized protein n=1 Tax=Cinnamomum micranthum f. kanehirae TaxID=337451 RepID=A0A3S3QV12_9MAGN|nr:hypothetical protein CKAN_01911200 [Cinnamomum micranthum f. kanehirae]